LALDQHILAVQQDLAAHDAAGLGRQQPQDRERRHRLARARLPDETERLPGDQAEAHTVDGAHEAPARVELGVEIADVEETHTWRNRGSSQSRSQSPKRLKASTTSRIAVPGTTDSHQPLAMWLRPSATICPHDGVGGAMPAPRNDSDASTMITDPMCRVSRTMNVFITLGTMWTAMILRWEQPCTRARATKSRVFTASTSPRTIRANRAQMISVTAITIVRRPWPRLTVRSRAMRIVGNVRVASTVRMMSPSRRPPT